MEDNPLTFGDIFDSSIKESIIFNFDIMGYQDLLKKLGPKEMFSSILKMKKLTSILSIHSTSEPLIETKSIFFTDNCVISFKDNDDVYSDCFLAAAISLVGVYQYLVMRECGFLIRGGVSKGLFYSDEFVFGEGYMKAYLLESKSAHYSRIVVDSGITDRLPLELRDKILFLDKDGRYIIDYVSCYYQFLRNNNPSTDMRTIIEDHSRMIINLGRLTFFEKIQQFTTMIEEHTMPTLGNFKDLSYIAMKYNALLYYHSKVCEKYHMISSLCPVPDNQLNTRVSDLAIKVNEYTPRSHDEILNVLDSLLSFFDMIIDDISEKRRNIC